MSMNDNILATLLAALAAAQGPASPQPEPINPDAWVTSDDYPAPAQRAAEEGRVAYRLSVDAGGIVTGCSIVQSSGSAILDVHTCDLMALRARFRPARDAAGRPTVGEYSSAVNWALPPGPAVDVAAMAPLDRTTIDIAVGSDGRVTGCTVVEAIGSPASPESLSPCARYPAGSRLSDPTTDKGRPVGGRIRITTSETRTYDKH